MCAAGREWPSTRQKMHRRPRLLEEELGQWRGDGGDQRILGVAGTGQARKGHVEAGDGQTLEEQGPAPSWGVECGDGGDGVGGPVDGGRLDGGHRQPVLPPHVQAERVVTLLGHRDGQSPAHAGWETSGPTESATTQLARTASGCGQ